MEIGDKILTAICEYDRRQAKRKFYNIYALPQYIKAKQNAMELIETGVPVSEALADCFCGRLLDFILKRI